MNNILFKIPNDITKQEVINKMNYFKEKSQEIRRYSKMMLLMGEI